MQLLFYIVPVLYALAQWRASHYLLSGTNIPGICGVAVVAVTLWVLFHICIEPLYGNVLLFKIVYMPHGVKCPLEMFSIEEKRCEDGDIDGWSAWHLIDHFIMGLLYPHLSWEAYFVVFQSIICEVGEFIGGERARFIVDPGVNILGYLAGCIAYKVFMKIPDYEPLPLQLESTVEKDSRSLAPRRMAAILSGFDHHHDHGIAPPILPLHVALQGLALK